MNSRVFRLIIFGLLSSGLLAGCFATSPQVSYYSLYAPGQKPVPAVTNTSNLAVSIGPVTIPDILKQEKIATGSGDGRYHMAEYHRWSGELDRDFARALAERLSVALGTEKVAIFPWDQNFAPSCRVYLDVLNMAGEPGKEAKLSVRWAIAKPDGEQPLLVRRSEFGEVPAEAGYAAWVVAQQRNIAKLGEEVAMALRENLKP